MLRAGTVIRHLLVPEKANSALLKGGKWETVQTVTSGLGTKTMDIDTAEHKIYLPTAEFGEVKPGARPVPTPGTFMIVVVERR